MHESLSKAELGTRQRNRALGTRQNTKHFNASVSECYSHTEYRHGHIVAALLSRAQLRSKAHAFRYDHIF